MCTLSIISLSADPAVASLRDGYRVVVNRDESRRRPRAHPPARREVDGVACLWPTDPLGGGTWVGAAETGLTIALLNGAPTPMPPMPPKDRLTTRGLIAPMLLSSPDAPTALDRLEREFDLEAFAPFRLVAIDREGVEEVFWDRSEPKRAEGSEAPLCYVSSGLGDAKVAGRLDLFAGWWGEGVSAERQDAFHRHRWEDRLELSVLMSRADARTVSKTIVETRFSSSGADGAAEVLMRHADVAEHAPDEDENVVETALPVSDRAAC